MACQTITQTSTTTITSSSLSTSFETITSAGPSQTLTTSTAACASTTTLSDSNSVATTCASTTFSTFVTAVPGTTGTQTSTHVETVPLTFVSTATQLSTTCDNEPTSSTSSTSSPTSDSTPPPPPPTSPPPPPPPTSTDEFTTQVTTTPISLPNGSTVFSTVFVTQPVNNTDSQSQSQPTPSLNNDNGGGSSGGGRRAATIASAVVGSVIGVALLTALAFWLWKRSRRWDDIFDDSDDEGDGDTHRAGWKAVGAPLRLRQRSRHNGKKPRVDLDPLDPEPYHYGLVGSASAMNPPSLQTSMSSRVPMGMPSGPFSHSHTPSAPDEMMYLLPAIGSDGGRLYPNGMVDPFASAVPPPIHPQTPSPRPMSARGSPRPSTGSTDALELASAASAAARATPIPGIIQVPGPSTRPAKPASRPQSAGSPVLVHQDAGPVSPDTVTAEPPSYKD